MPSQHTCTVQSRVTPTLAPQWRAAAPSHAPVALAGAGLHHDPVAASFPAGCAPAAFVCVGGGAVGGVVTVTKRYGSVGSCPGSVWKQRHASWASGQKFVRGEPSNSPWIASSSLSLQRWGRGGGRGVAAFFSISATAAKLFAALSSTS